MPDREAQPSAVTHTSPACSGRLAALFGGAVLKELVNPDRAQGESDGMPGKARSLADEQIVRPYPR